MIRAAALLFGFIGLLVASASLADPPAETARAASLVPLNEWQPTQGAFKFDIYPALEKQRKPSVFLCPRKLDIESVENREQFLALRKQSQPAAPADARQIRFAAACQPLSVQRLPDIENVSHFAALVGGLGERFVAEMRSYYLSDQPFVGKALGYFVAHGDLLVFIDDDFAGWLEVGLTSRILAALLALALMLAFAWWLAKVAKHLGLPGPRSPKVRRLVALPLQLISKSDNRASLSQFQIILWTFVVGGGAIYMVALNGSLIPISVQALTLLGISGGVGILSRIKDEFGPGMSFGSQMPVPGRVQNITVTPQTDSSDLIVKWSPPADRTPISHYEVWYESAPAAPDEKRDADFLPVVRDANVRLVGLRGGRAYKVSVFAVNPGGRGDRFDVADPPFVVATTGPSDMDPADDNGPAASQLAEQGPVSHYGRLDLQSVEGDLTDRTILLEWTPAAPNLAYDIQYRRAVSVEGWRPAGIAPPGEGTRRTFLARDLESGVVYQFRVRRHDGTLWSQPKTFATIHVPSWSDLVTEPDSPAEIVVTRVQMLVFTLASAAFVALHIADSGIVPPIPDEYVQLMGISNGVYIIGKWVRR